MSTDPAFIVADWPAPSDIRTATSLRIGGVSIGEYSSLNLAAHVGDDPLHVEENRRRFVEALALPSAPAWLQQVHGGRVVDLDIQVPGEADGAVSRTPGTVLGVLTADCLPVFLCTDEGDAIGVAHAGWRGLLAGVLPAAVAALGASPGRVLAWLGPAIGSAAYEVGEDIVVAFAEAGLDQEGFFRTSAGGSSHLDLDAVARHQLAAAGVDRVFGGGLCTASDPDRFFSHRRDAGGGRMASLIWRESLSADLGND